MLHSAFCLDIPFAFNVCAAVEQLLYFRFIVIESKAKKQLPFSLA